MKALTAAQVKAIIGSDGVTVRAGVYTSRTGYFYRHGLDDSILSQRIKSRLDAAGFKCKIIDSGDQFRVFRGGDTLKQGSHFWVKFTVESNPKSE